MPHHARLSPWFWSHLDRPDALPAKTPGPALQHLVDIPADIVPADLAWRYACLYPLLMRGWPHGTQPLAFEAGRVAAVVLDDSTLPFVTGELGVGLRHVQTDSPAVCSLFASTVPSFHVNSWDCVEALRHAEGAVVQRVQCDLTEAPKLLPTTAFGLTLCLAGLSTPKLTAVVEALDALMPEGDPAELFTQMLRLVSYGVPRDGAAYKASRRLMRWWARPDALPDAMTPLACLHDGPPRPIWLVWDHHQDRPLYVGLPMHGHDTLASWEGPLIPAGPLPWPPDLRAAGLAAIDDVARIWDHSSGSWMSQQEAAPASHVANQVMRRGEQVVVLEAKRAAWTDHGATLAATSGHGWAADQRLGRRVVQEDAWLVDTEPCWAVLDGMDGNGGALPAYLAQLRDAWHQASGHDAKLAALNAVEPLWGASVTLVMLSLNGSTARVSWLGDSRAYLLRDGVLRQLSEDHSLLNAIKAERELSPREEMVFPYKNVITQVVNADSTLADIAHLTLEVHPQDRFILLSDGVYNAMSEVTLQSLVSNLSPHQAVEALLQEVQRTTDFDNATAMVIDADATARPVPSHLRTNLLRCEVVSPAMAQPEWTLSRHDPSLPVPQVLYSHDDTHRWTAARSVLFQSILAAFEAGELFAFDYTPALHDRLTLQVNSQHMALHYDPRRGWHIDRSKPNADRRLQLVTLHSGVIRYAEDAPGPQPEHALRGPFSHHPNAREPLTSAKVRTLLQPLTVETRRRQTRTQHGPPQSATTKPLNAPNPPPRPPKVTNRSIISGA